MNRTVQGEVDFSSLAKKCDHSDMASIIEGTPSQIDFAISDQNLPKLSCRRFEKVIVIGMGGSALPIDVLSEAFADKISCPLQIHRHYGIPLGVNNRTLLVLSSFSGTTEETLSALNFIEAGATNAVVLTANGDSEAVLLKTARERRFPVINIPKAREVEMFQPRSATGYMVTYLARLLMNCGLLDDVEAEFKALPLLLRNKCSELKSNAKDLALQIHDQIPIFYTDQKFERSVARVAKIKFNENTKRSAFFNVLPEANHNEMIGFSRPMGKFAVIYLKDPDSLGIIHSRFNVMKNMFKKTLCGQVQFYAQTMPEASALGKIFLSHMFVDWLTYFVALMDGVDPTPVNLVEDFKMQLASVSKDSTVR